MKFFASGKLKKTFLLLAVAFLIWPVIQYARATILITCPGNSCANNVTIGGHSVDYYWTQNLKTSASSLKVRFHSGPFAGGAGTVRFKVTVDSAFKDVLSLKNPDGATLLPPTQSVDVANNWVERSGTPSVGQIYDFVQELRYDSVSPGTINLTIEIAQYGVAQTFTVSSVPLQTVQVDALAPTNRSEGDALPQPPYASGYKQCYDSIDNDLNYRTDCSDANCAGALIGTSPNKYCEQPESTCNDGLDNDGNGKIDCADANCNGKPGNAAGDKFCGAENGGASHANCQDGFDNNGNGKTDCTDDAPGTGCWKTGFQDCAIAETLAAASDAGKTADQLCTNNIDNDRDQNNSESVDANAATGIDGNDYDCSCVDHPTPGDSPTVCSTKRHIPINETQRWDSTAGSFVTDLTQCADGKDSDLDGQKDCADTDCLGSTSCARFEAWLPPQALGTGAATSTPATYYNFCNDGIDNDGNGTADALDAACKNRFGECSPAGGIGFASTENISFLSCSDTVDNDLNAAIDCADAVCRTNGKIGRAGCTSASCGGNYLTTQTDAAACQTGEFSPLNYCGDGLDNDHNGLIDCADASCNGKPHGPALGTLPTGYACGAETGASCSDGYDNDGNGSIDCLDASCQNGVQCASRAPVGWTLSTCTTIPNTTALAPIAAPSGSVQFAHNDRIHVNDPYQIRFTGSGSYSSLTIVIGDAVDATKRFPFDAQNCTLSGTGAGQMQYVSNDPKVGTVFEQADQVLNDFDVTLTCTPTTGTPAAADDFTVAVVANNGGTVEFGQSTPSVRVYENVPPVLSPTAPAPTPGPAIDVEGVQGTQVNIPVGGTVRFQAKPGDAAPSSGICKCGFDLNGTYVESPDGNCTATSAPIFTNIPSYSISASAFDGAQNQSATSTQTININLVPSINRNLTLASSRTTYQSNQPATFDTTFQTAGAFASGDCRVFICADGFSCAQQGPSTTDVVPAGTGTNQLTCFGTYTPPQALAGGRYWIFVESTDDNGNIIRSNMQSFLKCDLSDAGTGDCKDADLDNDGVPEGRYTPNGFSHSPPTPDYLPAGANSSCDNCINLSNPNQQDKNGNGIGDACELSQVGRCAYKTCSGSGTACMADSDCSGSDRCIVVDQQMCTVNCTVATEATDCALTLPDRHGSCVFDWGVCAATGSSPNPPDEGQCCFNGADCTTGKCAALVQPSLQTVNGQVYSGGNIASGEPSPVYNATYCLQANGTITNFTSAAACQLPGQTGYQVPSSANNYVSQFGSLDIKGILGGKYGPLVTGAALPSVLGGQIFLYDPGTAVGMTISGPMTFMNGSGPTKGNGLIIVKGDLVIDANMSYENVNPADLKYLASVGWIVLKNNTCAGTGPGCGNVIINGTVTNTVGAIFAEGKISTGISSNQLHSDGIWVANDFSFDRTYASRTEGAEKVDFDSRVLLNPPPGLTDVTRSLPNFRSVPGQ